MQILVALNVAIDAVDQALKDPSDSSSVLASSSSSDPLNSTRGSSDSLLSSSLLVLAEGESTGERPERTYRSRRMNGTIMDDINAHIHEILL